MAIYHLSVKTISRSSGRSATAAAAYRAGCKITDERTGEIHDYTHKGGVVSAELHLPENAPAWASDRAALWNAAEVAETRKNSTVAREFEIALPAELTQEQRRELANELAREIVKKHGCGVDVCIHEPNKKGDQQNHHAHILLTTRRLSLDGFGEKTRELDERTSGAVDHWRDRFAQLQNAALERAGHNARVDHRSLENQGIEREPTVHLGVAATGFERRTGEPSEIRIQHDKRTAEIKEKTDAIRGERDEINERIKILGLAIQDEKQKVKGQQVLDLVQSLIDGDTRQLFSLDLMERLDAQLAGFEATDEEINATADALMDAHKRELSTQPEFAGYTADELVILARLRYDHVKSERPKSQRAQALQRFDKVFSDPEKLADILKSGEQSAEKNNAQKSRDDGMGR